MSVESKGFHAHSNWYFRREPDGSVRILAPDSLGPGASQRVDLDPGTWASVVASVSAGGETSASFRAAEAMHAAAPSTAMNFGRALLALKVGQRVAREGWNGKGMFVVLQKGYPDGIAINANTAEATGIPQGTVRVFRPYLMLHTADGSFVPWAPTVSDVLAEDWATV